MNSSSREGPQRHAPEFWTWGFKNLGLGGLKVLGSPGSGASWVLGSESVSAVKGSWFTVGFRIRGIL